MVLNFERLELRTGGGWVFKNGGIWTSNAPKRWRNLSLEQPLNDGEICASNGLDLAEVLAPNYGEIWASNGVHFGGYSGPKSTAKYEVEQAEILAPNDGEIWASNGLELAEIPAPNDKIGLLLTTLAEKITWKQGPDPDGGLQTEDVGRKNYVKTRSRRRPSVFEMLAEKITWKQASVGKSTIYTWLKDPTQL